MSPSYQPAKRRMRETIKTHEQLQIVVIKTFAENLSMGVRLEKINRNIKRDVAWLPQTLNGEIKMVLKYHKLVYKATLNRKEKLSEQNRKLSIEKM